MKRSLCALVAMVCVGTFACDTFDPSFYIDAGPRIDAAANADGGASGDVAGDGAGDATPASPDAVGDGAPL
jgi:hypothetical protein